MEPSILAFFWLRYLMEVSGYGRQGHRPVVVNGFMYNLPAVRVCTHGLSASGQHARCARRGTAKPPVLGHDWRV